MKIPHHLKNFFFVIYGAGKTGQSVLKFLKKNKLKNYYVWDDNKNIRKKLKIKNEKNVFKKNLNESDYIIISPGINIEKSYFSKTLKHNRHKLITDLDLLYLLYKDLKSIVVTGTNGKSTTCKLIEHILTKKGVKVKLGGNIGNSALDHKHCKKTIYILEASSFQLEYSKFIKPNHAILLNLTKDHLDWHGNMSKYKKSKFKIFENQDKNESAYLTTQYTQYFKKKNFKGNLNLVSLDKVNFIKKKIKNNFINFNINKENISFAYTVLKKFHVTESLFIKYLNTFKGLSHRHEVFYKIDNFTFINDSKATSFESTKKALKNNKNIIWILGGRHKQKDKFNLNSVKRNIIKSYIIGEETYFFKKQLNKKIPFILTKTLNKTVQKIFIDIKKIKHSATILLSPASASFDQFKNFEDRGNKFKKLIKKNANKYF